MYYVDEYLDGTARNEQVLSTPSTAAVAPLSEFLPITPPASHCQIAIWNILPKHLSATCPLDHILLDFLSSRRLLVARGESTASVVGPPQPAISGLLNLDQITRHPISRVMVDIVATFNDVNIQEKLGFLYLMHSTMRVSNFDLIRLLVKLMH
jgi:hypothetical protein